MTDHTQSSDDPNALVTVYTVTEPTLAELIRAELEDENIPCEVSGENQGGLAGVLKIDLLVRAVDADRARKFIEEHEHRLDPDE
ncbi:MAG: DUF2007 domain-containing protein [Planctomycetota bacterium]|nr:MAG: DUF2007 domain-containing protein [Planctomycetota bacterium]REJ85673.1 MAG: DUF2007 domain-containing protein [Planctomycetota bacterium]REK21435.1 MAG: DUF2007 domain-containing protein [Planctomycetota bacterium]REK40053.1 MAG: DUF2007 domain-containing protein [Planctomycetota bacterium]